MNIAVPKEIKTDEFRVGATPENVARWVAEGHKVFVEAGAGVGSGFDDAMYERMGAQIVAAAPELYGRGELIVKVKEPQVAEYDLIGERHTLFCYLHLAPLKPLTLALMQSGCRAIAYETVTEGGALPLLAPMSEIAGKMASLAGAHHLNRYQGGEGILLGGAEGVRGAEVLVIGAGHAGFHAAKVAHALGAEVRVLNRSEPGLRRIEAACPGVRTARLDACDLRSALGAADLVIGSVLIRGGAGAPKLITREMLRAMRAGSVFVDIAIDQGGIAETSRPTTHREPTFVEEGVIHYCVANMPGAYARTSTLALTAATAPYVSRLASGVEAAMNDEAGLAAGANVWEGRLTNAAVAQAQGLEFVSLASLLGDG